MITQTARPMVFMVAEPEATETTFQGLKNKLAALGPITDLVLDSSLCGDLMTLLQDAVGINNLPLAQPQLQVDDNQITITGQATLWQMPSTPVTLQFGDSAEGLTFSLLAGDLAGNPALNLTALAAHLLPAASSLPALTLAQLSMSATPQAKHFALDVTIQDAWPIPLGVMDMTVGELHMRLEYAHNAEPRLQAEMSGTTTIDQIAATVTVAIGEQLALTCAIPQINFTALTQTLLNGLALPDDLPAISFSDVALQVQPQTGDFAFQAASDAPWDFGLGGFAIEQTSLRVSRLAGAIQGQLAVTSAGPVAISDDTHLDGLNLTFDFEKGASWSAAGKLAATLLDHAFALEAEVRQEEGRTFNFAWQAADPIKLVDTELATLAVDALTFTLTRQAATAEPQATSQQSWKLTSHGAINLPHVLENAQGSLEIEQNEERTGLAFITEEGQISVALPLAAGDPTQTVTFTATPKRIAISREQLPNVATKQTIFEAKTELAITGLYPTLAAILPASTPVTFRADANDISLAVEKVVEGVALPLPILNLAEAEAELGEAMLAIRNLKLALGRTVALSAEMALELPDAVNQLLGADTTTQLFNQHLACTIGADSLNGLFFKVLTPIFQIGETEEDGHVLLDFGDFGAVRYAPLVVSYDGTNFAASGEFEQVRPLKLPLTFLQKLLKANQGTKFLADMLPDSIPFKRISVLQEDGTLDSDAFNQVLREICDEIGVDSPEPIFELLAKIAQHFNRLPADFRNYLEITIPDFFKFAVAVTPAAGFGLRLDLQTREDEAIRFLYPVLLPVPTLMGVTLRKLAIGEIFSGSLLLTEIDAVIDQFDLPTLAATLALPVDQTDLLPDSTQVGRKFTVRNLFMPIFYQAGIPIPFPLFYDDLGFEYLGLEGLGLGLKWQFPKPQGGITDLIALFKEMAPFFTQADTELDPNVFDKHNLGLHFRIAPGFAQLPKYLGGKVLGSQDQLWDTAMGKAFAQILNAMKRPALAKIIPVAPLAERVGVETINLGGMNFGAAWAITTGEEFKTQLTKHKPTGMPFTSTPAFVKQLQKLALSDQAALLNLAQMSTTPQKGEQDGAVILLLGDWAVKDLAAFNVQVGLAQSPQLGFSGGASFRGQIGNVMSLQANGNFVFDQGRVKLRGANALRLANQTIFTGQGDIEIAQQYLRMAGGINLFPNSRALQVRGTGSLQINHNGQVALQNAVSVTLANFNLVGATLSLTNKSVNLTGNWLGANINFAAQATPHDFTLFGQADIQAGIRNTPIGPIYDPITGHKVVDRLTLDTTVNSSLAITLNNAGFAADVTGNFTWQGVPLAFPAFPVRAAFGSMDELGKAVAQQIEANAATIFKQVFGNVDVWLRYLRSDAIQFSGNLVQLFKEQFKLSLADAAAHLKQFGKDWLEIATALKGIYEEGPREVILVLKKLNAGWNELASVLKNVFGQNTLQAMPILKGLGAGWNDLGGVLRHVYGEGAEVAAGILRRLGAGWNDLGGVLRHVYGEGAEVAAGILRRLGASWGDLGSVVRHVYGEGAGVAAGILRRLGAGWNDLGGVLRHVYGQGVDDTVRILKGLGADFDDLMSIVKDVFNITKLLDIARILGVSIFDL